MRKPSYQNSADDTVAFCLKTSNPSISLTSIYKSISSVMTIARGSRMDLPPKKDANYFYSALQTAQTTELLMSSSSRTMVPRAPTKSREELKKAHLYVPTTTPSTVKRTLSWMI
ncbi:hypothetical protein CHS0354_013465 [Potamilus streckersoni]|uniref:Uncharacterized protein n=1 Tax=Potamilus streckersoni TaxID=2493646 RepID=A0AAE0RYJ0_9BIVA|nr:hypothetical protein CHS0354_013465 [Potamilus streckersoni]